MIITIGHTKGGVGKSTLAFNIAHNLQQEGHDVAIIDLDFQQTLYYINEIRGKSKEKIPMLPVADIAMLVKYFQEHTGVLIVDVGGFDSDINRTAIKYADELIVPITNSITEVLGFKTFEKILKEESPVNANIGMSVLLNRIHPLTRDFTVIKKAIGDKPHIRLLDTIVRSRKVYAESLGVGKSVLECKDEKAKEEIQGVCNELRCLR